LPVKLTEQLLSLAWIGVTGPDCATKPEKLLVQRLPLTEPPVVAFDGQPSPE